MLSGVCYCAIAINVQFNDLPKLLVKNSSITGTIISLPQQRKHHNRFFFKLSSIEINRKTSQSRAIVLIYWPGIHDLSQGQQLKLQINARPIHGLSNQGGFNYQKWLISTGAAASAKVVAGEILKDSNTLRSRVSKQLDTMVGHLSHARFIKALSIADKRAFTDDDWLLLSSTGTSHLFAISGLHLSLVFGFTLMILYPIFTALSMTFKFIPNSYNGKIAICGALLVACGYSALAGFSLPTVRALVMLTIVVLASLLSQRLSVWQIVIFSLFFVLLFDPMSVLSQSFWLSFCAVISLLILGFMLKRTRDVGHRRYLNRSIQLLVLQCWLFVTLLGLQLVFFGGLSLVAPVANLIAVPLVSLLVLPIILIGLSLMWLPSVSVRVFELVELLIRGTLWWLKLLTDGSQGWIYTNHLHWWLLVVSLIMMVVLGLLLPNNRFVLVFLPLAICSMLLLLGDKKVAWTVHFLDVGQGNSAVIIKDRHALIIDTGKSARTDIATMVVLPFLRSMRINQVDYVMLTHQDNDHSGGWGSLTTEYPATSIISNRANKPSFARVLDCHQLTTGGIEWQQLRLTFFIVPDGLLRSENDNSCLIKISDDQHSVLFTGDISKRAEKYYINNNADFRSDVIQVPHHGSNSSSSAGFVNLVNPELAIISASRFNQWHFPAQRVVAQYLDQGSLILTTSASGQISVNFYRDGGSAIKPYRNKIAPFWYNQTF
ncbi:MAG: DNA internalization-related competence protein ComEC/Rec2 [Gammaproteobacteria bacterium]|nr:DNA internalization-related competence protein ComEC/Rec2 [Gammaproteobacteria bacterium]